MREKTMKYNAIMERVVVTPEMRARIMDNLSGVNFSETKPAAPILYLPGWKKYLTAAACLVLLIAGAFAVAHLRGGVAEPLPDEVQTPWGTVAYSSAAELSAAVGFDIADLPNLPFAPTETVYQKYNGNLAEIIYADDSQSLNYRVSKGSEDNSGDYNEYETTYLKEINGISVSLEGNGELIHKAVYEQDGYSYSITASEGFTEVQLVEMLGE